MSIADPLIRAYENGKKEGIRETRKEVLDYLEQQYMRGDVIRGEHIATEILKIARELSRMMQV
jgi:hypothetical protein